MTRLNPVDPGKILRHQFVEPFDLSNNRLAKNIGVTPARINEIVRSRRGITAETAPSNCGNSIRGLRNQVLLRLGYETIRRRSELCAFKFEDICQPPNRKPAIRLNFSKTDQFRTGKILPISQELFDVLEKWRSLISDEGYILRSISRHGHIGNQLHPESISTLLKGLQKDMDMDSDEQPLSGHSFRVGAALDLLEQGEQLERIILRGGWQTDSTAMNYLRNFIV